MSFKSRLLEACESNTDIPSYGSGRQSIIAKKMGVSSEAVRKWFSGESTPRPQAMKALAKTLSVDHVWLALGTDYKKTESLKEVAKLSDTAMFAFCGMAMENGYSFALNDDSSIGADLVLIKQGNIVYAKLLPVDVRKKNKAKLPKTPSGIKITKIIAARNRGGDFSYDFYKIPTDVTSGGLTFESEDHKGFLGKLEIEHLIL
jgi:transcriptional regulator with XRE-family HTH domain